MTREIHMFRVDVITRVATFLHLDIAPSVSQPVQAVDLVSVPVPIIDILVVLPPWTSQRLDRVQRATWPKSDDPVSCPPVSPIPTPAVVQEHRLWEKGIDKSRPVGYSLGLDLHCADVVLLELADALDGVVAGAFDHLGETAAADAGIWTEHQEKIGEPVDDRGEVRVRERGEAGRQVGVCADHRKRRRGHGVEAGGTDNHVEIDLASVRQVHAGRANLCDRRGDEVDIVFSQGFQIPRPGSQATAPGGKLGNEELRYLGVLGEAGAHELFQRVAGRRWPPRSLFG